jgi:hypothetical protein
MAGQPGTRHLCSNRAALETFGPFAGPGADLAVKLAIANFLGEFKRPHEPRRVDQHAAFGVQIEPFTGLDVGADDDVFDVPRMRHQVGPWWPP